MSFQIIRNDITKVKADVIVNSANPDPTYGSGTDAAIYHAAGEKELLEARKAIGPIAPGQSRYTPAFHLQAKYIIHTVGPYWTDGDHGEADQLRNCYRNSLTLARDLHAKSIAFPLISTGNYGFPKDLALQIALESFSSYLFTDSDLKITLVVFDQNSFVLSGNVFGDLDAFIDENYVGEVRAQQESLAGGPGRGRHNLNLSPREKTLSSDVMCPSLAPELQEPEIPDDEVTFQQALLHKLDEQGLKDSDFYHSAGLTKQVFSKLRSNKDYQPSRNTAIACALALHLDLPETEDLLRRAGYAFSPTSLFDVIIEYCIRRKVYSLYDVNAALYGRGEKQLKQN